MEKFILKHLYLVLISRHLLVYQTSLFSGFGSFLESSLTVCCFFSSCLQTFYSLISLRILVWFNRSHTTVFFSTWKVDFEFLSRFLLLKDDFELLSIFTNRYSFSTSITSFVSFSYSFSYFVFSSSSLASFLLSLSITTWLCLTRLLLFLFLSWPLCWTRDQTM